MATVVTVHGTFAHVAGGETTASDSAAREWWQRGSGFEEHVGALVTGGDGRLDFVPFVWDGSNSERSRRAASSSLLSLLCNLEERKERYCLIGHSHGGSVISSALLDSAARGKTLDGLGKWITVGTPFVRMKKEIFLFARLALFRKVLFVASLMLLMMFLFYVLGEIFGGASDMLNEARITGFVFSAIMMSLPFIVFYGVLRYLDSREHYTYGRRPVAFAREAFAGKWVHFFHEDDEAVHGLKVLPDVKLHLFDRAFAVPALTMASIFALPLLYLYCVTSPPLMVSIADFLKKNVYEIAEYGKPEGPLAKETIEMQRLARRLRLARREAEKIGFDFVAQENARQEVEGLRKQLRDLRGRLHETYPTFAKVERAQRFKRQFLEQNGTPCEGGTLCGRGTHFSLNSKLLFHVVTDELSSAVVNDDLQLGVLGRPVRLLVPLVLVPVAFGIIAVGILAVIRVVARYVSIAASAVFNRLTLAEIKRSAFGNDTDGEVALGVDHRPSWIPGAYSHLPREVGDKIADHCNQVTFQSLAKFRNAISTLAFSEGEQSKSGLISSYLTWKELIHTTYFEVPEFRKLVAYCVSQAEGFAPTDGFGRDPDFRRSAAWLAAVEPKSVA